MAKTSEKNADLENAKNQLEAIAGQKLDITPEQIISLLRPVGAHDYTDGTVLWKRIIFPGQSCVSSSLLDGSGSTATGANGSITFLLSSFICLPQIRSLAAPVNVQATVRSEGAFFLTMTYSLVPDPNVPQSFNDLQITVRTWDANGAAAPGVPFDWRCRLVSNPIIL